MRHVSQDAASEPQDLSHHQDAPGRGGGSTDLAPGPVPDLALAVMPFALCAIPAIGPATLKACLEEKGRKVQIFDFNLEYLAAIGEDLAESWQLHDEIAYLWDFLPGEWLFSPFVSDEADRAYLGALSGEGVVPRPVLQALAGLRSGADAFADYAARRLLASGAPVVGFTTSFMQTQPSLAVARHLKRLNPALPIIFGGANCFGEMGKALLDAYPQIDVVATGEADETLLVMLDALKSGDARAIAGVPGFVTRLAKEGQGPGPVAGQVRMDALPHPDFSDYFATKTKLEERFGAIPALPMFLPIETARGCWWGAKSHCTFCGLNADRMQFRAKSADRAVMEFETQAQRYGLSRFFVVDNILDHTYFRTVLPRLAESRHDFFIHYEIKANLRRHHVEAMREAGVMKVQPGIESLNSGILALMKKGISALQNIQTLKWLTEGGFETSWFILTGFPGETLSQYEEMAELLPKLAHLIPPGNLAPVYIERFSPYQTRPADFGITLTGHSRWYDLAFPELSPALRSRIAYRFDYEDKGRDPAIDRLIATKVAPVVESWKRRFRQSGPTLCLLHGRTVTVLVLGPVDRPERLVLLPEGFNAILRAADEIIPRQKLAATPVLPPDPQVMGARLVPDALVDAYLDRFAACVDDQRQVDVDDPDVMIAQLVEAGLLAVEDDRLLALPVDIRSEVIAALCHQASASAAVPVLEDVA